MIAHDTAGCSSGPVGAASVPMRTETCRTGPYGGRHVVIRRGPGTRGSGFTGSNLGPDDLKAFVVLAMEWFDRIDGVVNCTGQGPKGKIDEIPDEDWHRSLEVNLLDVIRMTRLVTPAMIRQGVDQSSTCQPSPPLSPIRTFQRPRSSGQASQDTQTRQSPTRRQGDPDEQCPVGIH